LRKRATIVGIEARRILLETYCGFETFSDMTDQHRIEANQWSLRRASLDRLRVENWLKIAEVLRWSPLFLAPMPMRILLGIASGVFSAIWLERKHFGSSSWIVGGLVSIGVLAVLLIGKRALSNWVRKMTSAIGGEHGSQVSARTAKAFASDALAYCRARASIAQGTSLEAFRHTCRRDGHGRTFNLAWWLVVIVQAISVASFGLGGLLPKLLHDTSWTGQNRFVQPLTKGADEKALHAPLTELVDNSPAPTQHEPQSSPKPERSETPEQIATVIKQRSRELVQLENKGDVNSLLALYAPTVDYFGTRTDVGALRREKEADIKKWVKRNYQIISEVKVSAAGEGRWRVSFNQTFECENSVGDRSTGRIASTLVFEHVDGSLRITAQDGPVSEYKKVAKVEAATPPPVQSPDQVAEGPPSIEELRPTFPDGSQNSHSVVIHKVPELKNLANHKMENDWLYGQFCLISAQGNIAYCRTFGRGILLRGEGLTSVEIEFTGGVHLGASALRALHDGRQLTFKVSDAAPIRLLSVTTDRNGKIYVRARSPSLLDQENVHY
jgi:hypothetical protein